MSDPFVIGIDLGGTNCRAGVVLRRAQDERGGVIVARAHRPVETTRSCAAVVDCLSGLVDELRRQCSDVDAVGIGAAGLVDYAAGRICRSPHFPAWVDFPLRDRLADRLQCPVALDNDTNVIALGEMARGAAVGCNNFLMCTLGTGIGGALVVNGALFRGDHGGAGEVGHIVIDQAGPPCPCGGSGCWERYASASGLPNVLRQLPATTQQTLKGCTAERMAQMACEGDPAALALWRRFGHYVGVGVASLVNAVGIDRVVIGGGLSGAWVHFIAAARDGLRAHTYPETADRVQWIRATLGDDAGIIGAAQLRSS